MTNEPKNKFFIWARQNIFLCLGAFIGLFAWVILRAEVKSNSNNLSSTDKAWIEMGDSVLAIIITVIGGLLAFVAFIFFVLGIARLLMHRRAEKIIQESEARSSELSEQSQN